MTSRDTPERGPQTHAEGEYGQKTRDANRDRLQRRDDEPRGVDTSASTEGDHREGGHRIREDRQQHDEAELRSEKNRLAHDKDKRGKGPGSPGRESRR
jgi:hypothetical protein